MNMKKVLQSILVLSCIAVFAISCQDEENETRQNEETLSKIMQRLKHSLGLR